MYYFLRISNTLGDSQKKPKKPNPAPVFENSSKNLYYGDFPF